MSAPSKGQDSGKTYHKACTGKALDTVKQHIEGDDSLIFFAACFCPFVQRAWIAFEELGVPYRYYEVDPYAKPADLLEVSPKGLVPGLRLKMEDGTARGVNESTVILEYIEEAQTQCQIPSDARALARLQADYISRTVIPAFYRYLQAQDEEKQIQHGKEYLDTLEALTKLFERAERETTDKRSCGLWREDGELGLADAMVGPWIARSMNVLKHYRGFTLPSSGKFGGWVKRLLEHPSFASTCSTDDLYLDSYERYAFNRPNTSQVANAINSGRGLP